MPLPPLIAALRRRLRALWTASGAAFCDTLLWRRAVERVGPLPELAGGCTACGACCRNLTLVDRGRPVKSRAGFARLRRRRPEFAVFVPAGRRDDGYLSFSCTRLGEDNRCRDYDARPAICRNYPDPAMFRYGATLPTGCGYWRRDRPPPFVAVLAQERRKRE